MGGTVRYNSAVTGLVTEGDRVTGVRVGDEVLIALGEVIRDSVRQSDVAARIGGADRDLVDPAVARPGAFGAQLHVGAVDDRVGRSGEANIW